MTRTACSWFVCSALAALALAGAPAFAQDDNALGFERTPPRLSFTDGEVSFWRPGASDWSEARVNTALAAGDELATGEAANLELQVGARAWVRAGEASQLGLTSLEPDFLQLKLTTGTAALDVRELAEGRTFEIDTPNAAFTIERPGFYRIAVSDDATTFTTRRGGRATLATRGGLPTEIEANEQLVVTGSDAPVLVSQGAPELDDWDRWNYSRSEEQANPESARYVPADVYGTADLDGHGSWRRVPTYGAVWVPRVAVGWAPYTAGYWVPDPYYGWTWVDDAPWGWAPFHYGRWVYVNSYWAWAPGPRVARAYYSPALVAFYGSKNFSIGVSFGGAPYAGWVALGWGEPVIPWWGPRGCKGYPRWAGWGGPRYVNNVQINNYTTVYAKDVNRYSHWDRKGAFVAVDGKRFGRGHVRDARVSRFDRSHMRPVGDRGLDVRRERSWRVEADRRRDGPSRDLRERRVVTRRDMLQPGMRDPSRARSRDGGREGSREVARGRDGGAQARERARGRGANEDRLRGEREARARRGAPPPMNLARAETSNRRRSGSSGRESVSERRSVSERGSAARRNDAAGRNETAAPRRGGNPRDRASRAPDARARDSGAANANRPPERGARRESAAERRAPSAPREPRASAPRGGGRNAREAPPRTETRGRRENPRPRERTAAERAPRASPERAQRSEPRRAPERAERREPPQAREQRQPREPQVRERRQPQAREPQRNREPSRAREPQQSQQPRQQRDPGGTARERGDGGRGDGRRGGAGGDGGGRGGQGRRG